MVEEDPKNKKMRFIEAYLNQREEEHQKVYAQPASTRPVEPAMAYPWSRPMPREERPPSDRVSIRDIAMKRARPYLRPDQGPQEETRPSPARTGEQPQKYPSFLQKRSPGFKLVKEGADTVPGQSDAKRKRLCLYDLYAPRLPSDEECEPEPREAPPEEPAPEEPEEAPAETPEEPVSEEERKEVEEEAESVLWGGKKKTPPKEEPTERPILKVGPGRRTPKEEPSSEPTEIEVAPETHEEPKAVEEATPEAETPQAEAPDAKTAGGDFCASCGSKITEHNVPQICTGCGAVRCVKCNTYDQEHLKTSIYYDYQFDWPLCIGCYSKAFTIQKSMAKAMTCFGNGNLTYAIYYAQNAIRMDPNSKYAEAAAKLIQRVDEARAKKESMDKAWRAQAQRISRTKYQDPGWKEGSAPH